MLDVIIIMQVPLGVLLNENKGDEMVEILSHLHQYVPSYEYAKKAYPTTTGELQHHLMKILFGGDQLTVTQARRARVNSLSAVTRLEGIIPCAEDWHVKLNLLDGSFYGVFLSFCLRKLITY